MRVKYVSDKYKPQTRPSRAPTSLEIKAQVLPMAHKVLHDLPHPLPDPPPPCLPLAHSAPATQASSLFLQKAGSVLPQDLCTGCSHLSLQ